jgi:hypothetical protein
MALQKHLAQVDGTGRIVALAVVAVEACGNQKDHTVEAVKVGTGEPRIIAVLDKEVSVAVLHQWSSRYMHKLSQS